MKNLLVLGAGLTAGPLLRYFVNRRDIQMVVASNDLSRARLPLMGSSARLLEIDVTLRHDLEPLIREAAVVVSLLPSRFHADVAELCVRSGVHMVNPSYRSQAMLDLDAAAKATGTTLLSEVGLDPGIDHMSSIRLIESLRARGARITSFMSSCGGIPSPESNTNPWGYKFSWSPMGVVQAARQPARYLIGGEMREVSGAALFEHCWPYELAGYGDFEVYPNRDSLAYVEPYGLRGVDGMLRGTIRYPGWCETMKAAERLGFLEIAPEEFPAKFTYADFVRRRLPPAQGALSSRVAEFLGVAADADVVARLAWAGLFEDRPVGLRAGSGLEVFVSRLEATMNYMRGERDMIALQHDLAFENADGSRERLSSTLVELGREHGDSAMARTVSLPAAIAARLLLDGKLEARGSILPVASEIYDPVLDEMEEMGMKFVERSPVQDPVPFRS